MSTDDRPNVLLLVLEDTSPRLGCYGDDVARTPNADRLASEGRRYTDAYATSPTCAPSRAAMMTGCYQTRLGAHHMRTPHEAEELPGPYAAVPPHYVRLFTEYLRRAGYYCTNDGSTDFQFTPELTDWPVTAFDDCAHEFDDRNPDWRDRPDGAPFCAIVNPVATHESGMWPPDESLFDEADENGGGGEDGTEEEELDTDPEAVAVPPQYPDTPPVRRAIARHYDGLARVDEVVGRTLDRLAADGLADETVVVLTSDHGWGLPRAKRWPYDAGVRVPLVVRWPGRVDGGTVTDRLVSLVDLAPTLLSVAGVDVPAHLDGRPFLGPDATEREFAFAARDRHDEEYDMVRSVRDGRYAYVRNYYQNRPYVGWVPFRNRHPVMQELLRLHAEDDLSPAQRVWFRDRRPAEELYDGRSDPQELENLASDPDPEVRAARERLSDALDAWRDRADPDGDRTEAAMVREQWPDGEQPTTATPTFVPNAPGNRAREPTPDGGTFDGPMTVRVRCPTQGASVEYRADDGRWRLYDGPVRLAAGERIRLSARAVRYGYAESEVRTATFAAE